MSAASSCSRMFLGTLAIQLGLLSFAAPVAQAAPFAYISNQSSNNVSVIDTATNTVIANVPVGTFPSGVAVNPAGTRAFVVALSSVSVINTATNTVIASVAVGSAAQGVAVNPAGTRAYVTNSVSNNVSVIDTATNTVVATVSVGIDPRGVAVNPAGTRAYVVNRGSTTVSVIDTASNTVVATVAMGLQNPLVSGSFGVAVNPAGTRAYVVHNGSQFGGQSFSVIDTATNAEVATVALASGTPRGIAINPAGTRAYVTNGGNASNFVEVIDTATHTVVATVAVGANPLGIAVTPDGTRAYVANSGSNNVSVIDTAANTVVNTVAVGSAPQAFGLFIGGPAAPSLVVTPSAGANGTITPATPQTVAQGSTITFTVTPDSGYTASVAGTCGGTLAGMTYTTNAITAACTVVASFAPAGVTTFSGSSATGSGAITATFTGGGPACTYTTSRLIPVTGDPGSPPAGSAPAGVAFPHGLFDFTLGACAPGSTITMTITYPAALSPHTRYWKYGPTPSNATPHWYVIPGTVSGSIATFTIADGGLGDDDLTANGTIVDQGGPGIGGEAIPTMSAWMMLFMAILILAWSLRELRRRPVRRRW